MVPTNDSIRNTYFLNLNIKNNMNFLLVGSTGTGIILIQIYLLEFLLNLIFF